jgi:integrase
MSTAMARRVPFTRKALDGLQAEPGRRVVLWDTEVPGLGLYATPAGHKSFFLEATFPDGRQSKMKLGRWLDGPLPAMTVVMARDAAKRALGLIAQGLDPRAGRRQQRGDATFGQLWLAYLEQHAKPHKRTWRCDVGQHKNHLAFLDSRRLSTISRGELAALHVELWERVGPATANRVLAQVAVMLELARDWGMLAGENPARRIRKARVPDRQRSIEKGEFPAFFRAVCAHPNETPRDAILMLLFTGARKSSVLPMRWDQVNLDLGRWLIPRTKTGDVHACPLTQPALEVLAGRRRVSEWVFPGARPGTHIGDVSHAWRQIRAAAAEECPAMADLRLHDLRRTMGSWQARTGASLVITSASLAHKSLQTTKRIYAVVDIEPTRLAMDGAVAAMANMAGGTLDIGGMRRGKSPREGTGNE